MRGTGCVVLLACTGIALSLGVVAPAAAGSDPAFGGPKSFPAGTYPFSVSIRDLNADARSDLAVANYGSSAVSVLLNGGGARFGARRDYETGPHPSSVALGDLNGDRKPDLATANVGTDEEPGTTISVLFNKGDGFEAKRDFQTSRGPRSVALGDLNGDGKLDLATANDGGTTSVLINDGAGGFETRRDYPISRSAYSVAIGKLNGDRGLDLVLADGRGVSVLLNRGGGSFAAARHYATGNFALSVAVADLNGDGKADVAAGDIVDPTVSLLLNKGDGTLQSSRKFPIIEAAYSVAIADLNGDRKPDLVATDSLGGPDETCDEGVGITVSVLVNRGSGKFAAGHAYDTGCDPVSIAIGNLNGDRKPDIATANNGANSVSVLVNATGRCVVPPVRYASLRVAKRTIRRANCSVVAIRSAYSKTVPKGHVISTTPKAGTVLPRGGKVNLVVSRGRRKA
jgi:hypothetical protein